MQPIDHSPFRGTGVALVTPFNQQAEVDYEELQKLIEHVIAGGVDYLVALGTTSESPTLSKSEKKLILDFVLEVNKGRLPVVAGVGGNNTAALVTELNEFESMGFSAILSSSPSYNKPSQEGIFRHYEILAKASPLPLLLYNVPGRTASNINAETTLRLASEIGNIIGIKEASDNFEQISSLLRDRPENFLVISGDDALALPLLALGGDGLISVAANALPMQISSLVKQALNNQYPEARGMHHRLSTLIPLLFEEGNPAGVKSALKYLGLGEDQVRLPLVPVTTSLSDRIGSAISAISALSLPYPL